jgi:predicted methyltransferase
MSAAAALDAALAAPHRSPENKSRDAFRHPKETLEFFGLTPTSTVVEIAPGGGWWSEIIAPVVAEHGKLILATPMNGPARAFFAPLVAKIAAAPELYGKADLAIYDPAGGTFTVAPGSADLILVARHMHGLMARGMAEKALALFHTALKPGGVLGIEAHRWPENLPLPSAEKIAALPFKMTGYLRQSDVVAACEKAGFKFAGASEVNANPADTHDHPGGVWSLAPRFSNVAEADKARYAAIGESDRMTLKFVKA